MAELLFEIFSEEIPARMQVRAGQDLRKAMDAGLKAAGLSPTDSNVMTGPRRMTYVTQVETRSPDVSEERKGPRVGSPERALAGFMRGAGLTDISQAETRSDKKGDYYVAVIASEGRDTAEILRDLIPDVMTGFSWPKSMKSGDSDFRWVRPLRGLTVLLDGRSLDGITVGGIASDALVHGHRQMGAGPFTVSSLADYRAALEGDGHVMIDRDARRARVLEQAKAVCADAGLELVEDAGLLDEVTGLVEWPVALLGDMDPDFLELPDEVIRLTLKSHQKTFTVRGSDGKLAPNFVIMANLETPDNGATIKAGNAKVISARLSDARFFQQQDRQKNLIDYYDQLDQVVFHKKLGSVRDKADRVAALAREIAPHIGADPDVAEYAAKLAKCDLVTQTVIEATSLQGQVGRWMYEAEVANNGLGQLDRPAHLGTSEPVDEAGDRPADQGGRSETSYEDASPTPSAHSREGGNPAEVGSDAATLDPRLRGDERQLSKQDHADIAVAIEDHYKPQGPSDAVPTNPVAVAVALADKIDTLVGFWAIDEKPTGSKDPYALRRAMLGAMRIVIENEVSANLGDYAKPHALKLRLILEGAKAEQAFRSAMTSLFADVLSVDDLNRQIEAGLKIGSSVTINGDKIFVPLNNYNSSEELVSWMEDIVLDLDNFSEDRLRVYLRDQGHRHDVIDAVIAQGGDDLLAISLRVEALGAFLSDADGENLVQGYKRAANILRAEAKKSGPSPVIPAKSRSDTEPGPDGGKNVGDGIQTSGPGSAGFALGRDDSFSAAEAKALAAALSTVAPKIDAALSATDYPAALSALANLREPIDAFFENVVVNSDDPDERARRLALLSAIVETFHRIADFSRLDG